jgi:PCI domain/eIF3 subunit M, C-terminal helix
MVSSILVNVAEDAELRLINSLSDSAGELFQQKCSACFAEGDVSNLLTAIFTSTSAIETLMNIEAKNELIAAVSLLSSMIQKVDNTEDRERVTMLLTDALCAGPYDELRMTERKITMISVLYNMFEIKQKCMLLNRMLQLAGNHSDVLLQPESILGRLISSPTNGSSTLNTVVVSTPQPPIVALLDSWKGYVSAAERRTLFSTICTILPESDRRKQFLLLMLVETYTEAASVDEAGIVAAKEATIGAIRDPVSLFRYQRDLLSRPAVEALRQSDADLHALLTVFQEGTVSDYEAFISSKGDDAAQVLSKWGLDHLTCLRYVRIFSLCSLTVGQEAIQYSEISNALHLTELDQVESWVIAAVSSGLLQAKMDQLAQIVMVERCVVRKFDMDQWKNLQSKLTVWKDHVGSILAALKQNQDTVLAVKQS